MSDLDRAVALGALDAAYEKVTGVTAGLGDPGPEQARANRLRDARRSL
ncbi:MAG: hypothetical protein J2P30_24540 [Actinobacteria bacterium]|nr:hypothetical protein [Actinomycetota bacterium]